MNIKSIDKVKETEQKRINLIKECESKCQFIETRIEKLTGEHKKSVLSALKPKSLLSKKQSEEQIKAELRQLKINLEIEKEKLDIIKDSSLKDEFSLEEIINEMTSYKQEKLKVINKIEQEAFELNKQYKSKAIEYRRLTTQLNKEITNNNKYLENIFNDDVSYYNGAYWDNKTGERVERSRIGISTLEKNEKLIMAGE